MNDPIPLVLLVIGGLIVLLIFGLRTQNRLAPLWERINEAHTNIRGIIEKKNRLIERLLEISSAYATHEREILQRISADFNTPDQIARNPAGALAYVTRLVNTFPELRADRTYLDLSSKLYALESELQQKHEQHSASVRTYNSVRQSFPHDMFAWYGSYEVANYLDGTDAVAALPRETDRPHPKVRVSSKVIHPRIGMRFRDMKDDTLWEIVSIENDRVSCRMINQPPDRTFGGSTEIIDYWKEGVAEGRYRIE